eukprot:gene12879-27163_t
MGKFIEFRTLLLWLTILHLIDATTTTSLLWGNITVAYKDRKILSLGPGLVESGRLLAVMGPSGCGKSTFLHSLAGRIGLTRNLKIVSDVQTAGNNGKILEQNDIGFVNQLDSHFGMLTVRETLLLSSALRLPTKTRRDRNERIDTVLKSLNLNLIANSHVGDETIRGISGGEKKRLSVGIELLGSPKLLIADEPTSGLDSFQAQQTIKILKKLAHENNIITILTIHQPSSTIWALLDDILILTPNGRVAYFGPRNDALNYFENLGYKCPELTNPAEFLIDLISLNSSSINATLFSQQQAIKIENLYESSSLYKQYSRIALLLQRAIKQNLRDINTNISRIIVSSILAFTVGIVFGPSKSTISMTISESIGAIMNGVINLCMLSMIKSLQTFKKEKVVVERERVQRQYTALDYLLSKSIADLPVDAFICALFGVIMHWRTRLRSNRFTFAAISGLVGVVSSSLGLAVGAVFPMGEVANAVGPALMVVYVITGGFGSSGT